MLWTQLHPFFGFVFGYFAYNPVCVQLWYFSWPCTQGLSELSCKKKWNTCGVRGLPYLKPSTLCLPTTPRPALWHRQTFEQLCNCQRFWLSVFPDMLSIWGWSKYRSRPMPPELHWQCFSAVLLLMICRRSPATGALPEPPTILCDSSCY